MPLGEPIQTCATSDDQLMLEFRAGDEQAFDVLFDRYHAQVYRFARMLLGNAAAAEEVLQETFIAVARAAPTYQCRGMFRPWLMRIARNRCLNQRQSARLHLSGRDSGDGADPDGLASSTPAPLHILEQREQVDGVCKAIGFLPPQQREALLLHVTEQMAYAEVATVMEIPINTVKTLIHRARANLVQATGEETNHGM